MSRAMRMVPARGPMMSVVTAARRGAWRPVSPARAVPTRALARRPARTILAGMPSAAALPTDPGPYGPTGRSAWMDVDWHAHLHFVEIDGRRVNVVEIGEGEPPVVFV